MARIQKKKPEVVVAPERRGLTKVWNITDWPATKEVPRTVVVLGRAVPPGGAVEVPAADLRRAHKLMKERDRGVVFVGSAPPQEYLQSLGRRKRLRLAPGMKRGHGLKKGDLPPAPKEEKAAAAPVKETAPKQPAKKELSSGFKELPPKPITKKSSEKK